MAAPRPVVIYADHSSSSPRSYLSYSEQQNRRVAVINPRGSLDNFSDKVRRQTHQGGKQLFYRAESANSDGAIQSTVKACSRKQNFVINAIQAPLALIR